MKIYIIGQKGIPAMGGGVETHVQNLSLKLTEKGHDVFVYTRHSYSDKKLKKYQKVNLISLPSIKTKSLDAISHTFLACLDLIFKRRADVVHFHSIGPASLIWLIKLFKPKTKIIFTFHSQCYFNTKWGRLAKFYLNLGERIGCKMADEVIVVSENLKKYVEDKYGRRVHFIPNGVNTAKILPANFIKNNWSIEKDSYILSVSRLVKNKGLEYLITAYNNISTDKKLVIVGDGSYINKLMKLASNNDNIIFTGKQHGDILAELYSNANLFVQSSEAEGLSISLLEAISYRLPILISDIEANTEVLGEDSFSFKNKDINDLKLKLEKYLNKNETEGLNSSKDLLDIDNNIEKKYNDIMSKYNWEDIVNKTIELYK
ncbi:MAG: glycosyltransferase family 4 protein [Patescibacteria group bacterium]|nr:glycosyltransferase family 4 protein [Patescibacteria group bacterium]